MDTVTQITETSPILRRVNTQLATQYINADLYNRAGLDIRKSFIFYDENKEFADLMLDNMVDEETLKTLRDKTKIRYWSKGIV